MGDRERKIRDCRGRIIRKARELQGTGAQDEGKIKTRGCRDG